LASWMKKMPIPSEESYRKVKDFFKYHDIDQKEGKFLFRFIVSEESLKEIDDLSDAGIEFDEFEGDQSYERRDLENLSGENLTAVLSKQGLSSSGLNVYSGWDEYLSYRANKLYPEKHFLILEDFNLYPFEKDRPSRLKNYLKIVKFIKFLNDLSELESVYKGVQKPTVTFVQKVRIDVSIDYKSSHLDNDLDGFESLERIFSSVEHRTQRDSLMRETLYSFLFSEKRENRFGCLISCMSEFSTQFIENFNLFVSEFSLEKVRKEYEESKREYISKVNEVVSGIHTRMLGIPAVLVLAAFRFSDKAVPGQVVGNIVIFSAVVVYALMMHYLIQSQRDTLETIKSEASEHIERFKFDNRYPEEVKQISNTSIEIHRKCESEIDRLKIFYWMVGVLGLVMLGLLAYSLGFFDLVFPSSEAIPSKEY